MHASYHNRPYIVFVDSEGRRIDQIDLGKAHSSYEAAAAASADFVQLYTEGKLKTFRIVSRTYSVTTGYTFIEIAQSQTSPNTEMEGQRSIDDL